MSGNNVVTNQPSVSLSAGVAKSVTRLKGQTDHRHLINMIIMTFNGTGPENDPVKVDWMSSANGGTFSTSGGGVRRVDNDMLESPRTGLAWNASVEPTSPTILKSWQAHPQGGLFLILPIDRPLIIPGAGDFFFLRCTAPQAVSVHVVVWIEE